MNPHSVIAYHVFLATLTDSERSALMDVLGSHVENVNADCDGDEPREHAFVCELSDRVECCVARMPHGKEPNLVDVGLCLASLFGSPFTSAEAGLSEDEIEYAVRQVAGRCDLSLEAVRKNPRLYSTALRDARATHNAAVADAKGSND
jgi:hypothetical protein